MTRSILFLLLALLPCTASAHKISVFAYGEGDMIMGEASFHGGKGARNVEISVTDKATGSVITATHTNDNGQFSIPISDSMREKQADLLIVANAGEGHRNEWLLSAADYLPESSTSESRQEEPEPKPPTPPESTALKAPPQIDEALLRKIVAEEVGQQIGPLKRMLTRQAEHKPSLQDIIGGIGYILGLAGLAALMKSRKEKAQ